MSVQAFLKLDRSVAECGGAVTGTASWSGNRGHRVGVVLRYWTEGRGDMDQAVAARCHLGVEEVGQRRFRVDVPPHGPVTYHGQLTRLLWQAALLFPVDRSTGRHATGLAVANLTVVPCGWTRLPPGIAGNQTPRAGR